MEKLNPPLSSRRQSLLEKLKAFISRHWQPTPIEPPKADPELERLEPAQRSAEVFRYSILSFEFWLSPLGRLREWLRLNGKVCIVLLIPAFLVLPLVTFIIGEVAHWLGMLIAIAGNLIALPLVALVAIAAITGSILLLRAIFTR